MSQYASDYQKYMQGRSRGADASCVGQLDMWFLVYSPRYVDRIWGIWGFSLPKGDYRVRGLGVYGGGARTSRGSLWATLRPKGGFQVDPLRSCGDFVVGVI